MKKLIIFVFVVCTLNLKAQFVTIPDANFVTWLQANIPSAISGNQMDTTNSAVTLRASLILENASITDLTGVQYFDGLKTLDFGNYGGPFSMNAITYLPKLPIGLDTLICAENQLTTLPNLPSTLVYLDCYYNHDMNYTQTLLSLPALPPAVKYLNCSLNQIPVLPALPSVLKHLACASNYGINLPAILPANLTYLDCSGLSLTMLPSLPNSIDTLICSGNNLSYFPNIPNALIYLVCFGNQISSIPPLPNTVTFLHCRDNILTTLPNLPSALGYLNCQNNQLTNLPVLPTALYALYCNNNSISCFSTFPNTLVSSAYFDISANPFNCLPNYISVMDTVALAYPLCGAGNSYSCSVATNCAPGVNYMLVMNGPQVWSAQSFYTSNTTNARWYWGDGTSSLGLYPSHTYSISGLYNICVTAFGSCGDSAMYCKNNYLYRSTASMIYLNVIHGSLNGISNKIENETPNIYPNPSNNFINIKGVSELGTISIFNSLGETVLQIKSKNLQEQIDIGKLPSGIYIVQIQDKRIRLIKE